MREALVKKSNFKYERESETLMNMRMHARVWVHKCWPCVHMLLDKKTLTDFFHYKTAMKGFQTFIKRVLSLGTIP